MALLALLALATPRLVAAQNNEAANAEAIVQEKEGRELYARKEYDEARRRFVLACPVLKTDNCLEQLALAELATGYYTYAMHDIDTLLAHNTWSSDPAREAQFRALRQAALERTTRNHRPSRARTLALRGVNFLGFIAFGFGIGWSLSSQGAANDVTAYRNAHPQPCSNLGSATCAAYRSKVSSQNTQTDAAIDSYIIGAGLALTSTIVSNLFLLLNELKPPSERTTSMLRVRPLVGVGFAGIGLEQRF